MASSRKRKERAECTACVVCTCVCLYMHIYDMHDQPHQRDNTPQQSEEVESSLAQSDAAFGL